MQKCPKCKTDLEEGFVKCIGAGYTKICWAKENKMMYPFFKGLETLKNTLKAKRCNKCKIIFANYQ